MGVVRQSPPSPELKIFSERIKNAIAFKKINIVDLAKGSEYTLYDINKLLNGMREPSMKKLILLANTLGCSVDYLLGLTPEAKRASVVVQADTNALKSQSIEPGQTSGHISGKVAPFLAAVPKLLESDIELLLYIAGFLIERKEKGLARFMKAVNDKAKRCPGNENSLKSSVGKVSDDTGLDEDNLDVDDALWDGVDDGFEDEEFEEDEDFEENDDFEDDFDD
jgi:transcriptional regulator with XRE-family HTH domain